MVLKRALFGLKTESRSFHECFGDLLREMGFQPTQVDQNLWYRKSDDYDGYNFIATHVDDFLILAKNPMDYMAQVEQSFKFRDVMNSPKQYLGNELSHRGGNIHVSTKKNVVEIL